MESGELAGHQGAGINLSLTLTGFISLSGFEGVEILYRLFVSCTKIFKTAE